MTDIGSTKRRKAGARAAAGLKKGAKAALRQAAGHVPPEKGVGGQDARGEEAGSAKAASAAPLLLHAGEGAVPADAADLGFTAIGVSPLGRPDRPVADIPQAAVEAALAPAIETGLAVFADLPWRVHGPASPALTQHPGWFEAAPAEAPIADPRRAEQRMGRAMLTGIEDRHEAQAEWFAARVRRLAEAGVSGLRIPDLHHAPPGFWRAAIAASRKSAPDIVLIGDALGGPFEAAQALDGIGFDYLFDSGAWWDGREDWFLAQRMALSTPAMGFPEAPEGDDLSGRLRPGESLAEAASDRTARALLCSEGLLIPAKLLSRAGEAYRSALPPLLEWRRAQEWLDREGPLLTAGKGAVVRTDKDPRIASRGAALIEGEDQSAALKAAGGYLEAGEIAGRAGKTGIMNLHRRDGKADKAPPARAAEKRLDTLAAERVAIENVYPVIDDGRFPAKRIVGDDVVFGADIFADGHEVIGADLLLCQPGQKTPIRHPMTRGINDRWSAQAVVTGMGRTRFWIEAWRDLFGHWASDLTKKRAAGQNVALEAIEGRELALQSMEVALADKPGARDKRLLEATQRAIEEAGEDTDRLLTALTNPDLAALLRRHGERTQPTRTPEYEITVDRRQARFSSWYEMFPRSQSGTEDRHGTLTDVIAKLPYVRDLGFDVLYFPPIHPIGETNKKGKNNTLTPGPDDVGSPYAIGSKAGGHDALHPALGNWEDFDRLVAAAAEHGLEIALDFAIQCSPDHPWLKDHPEWFDWRPDGSIKYAENPPKKYEDIVNVHFYRKALPSLWYALRDVVLFWCERGVRIYRVDNPHTKPYPFWEWMIGEVKARFPDALFLSEAFTRPKVMKRLAKLGFTQSYTYYTWRNTKDELSEYVGELTSYPVREFMNPNFFVNTPDINPEPLQTNNRAAHIARTVLAGTLSASYGIYSGLEIVESTPLPGKEEYLDSEKYQIRAFDMDRPGHIKDEIRLLNKLRRLHPALQEHGTVRFLTAWNDRIVWFAKRTHDLSDYLLFAVTFDYEREQRAACELPLWEFGLPDDGSIAAKDLVSGQDFTWHGKVQEITLGPDRPFAAFQVFGPEKQGAGPLYGDPFEEP